ncbi:MAG: 3-methyl-2-oxobutanoate hydroxymethyltransferase [Bacteriovoracaceae bacterium]|nr:3-methyl-2-oxobutanoate hydroxymethyltransferase [Bacteriovoracaceae bacterium]
MQVNDFKRYKKLNKKISMVTCYDYSMAKILAKTEVNCLLVGDSVAMVMHGHESTLHADVPMMDLHTKSVNKGASKKFIVSDMPYMSFRKGLTFAMETVETLTKAGANAVKIEGIDGHEKIIRHIIESGVPVMGHLGLTPQFVNGLGGYRVQGKNEKKAQKIAHDAKKLEDLGVFAMVLECIPMELSYEISEKLTIPTIGIGAGPYTDGQVLVIQDLLGMYDDLKLKFVKNYVNSSKLFSEAVNLYDLDVKNGSFPTVNESFQVGYLT